MNTSPIFSALEFLDADRAIDDLVELVKIPSLDGTSAEVDAQRFMAELFAADGFDVRTWDVDVPATLADPQFPGQEVERSAGLGVVATLHGSGGGKTLLINGHTDVVPIGDPNQWSVDPFSGAIGDVDGEPAVFGRGAADMKGGVIAGLAAMRAIKASGIELAGDIVMTPVFGEEDGGFGTFAAIRENITADYCIITEPTELDIIPANGGALTFRVSVPGLTAHASTRTRGVSAIEKYFVIHQALAEMEARRNAIVDPVMHHWPLAYPLSIGTVESGDWASTVPDLLIANGRLGVALGESNEEARADLEAVIAAANASDPWLAEHPATVTWWGGQFASGQTPTDHELVTTVKRIHEAEHGDEAKVYGGPYGSDLRQLVGLAGIPTIQYGPGSALQAHAPDEFVRVSEVVQCARTLIMAALELCR